MSILAPQKYIDNKEEVLFARSPIPNFLNYLRRRRRKESKKSDDDDDIDVLGDDTSFDFDDTFDFAQFVRTHGHRIDHMIKKCRWKSQPCGPENFTAVITEFGLCYTFNSGGFYHNYITADLTAVYIDPGSCGAVRVFQLVSVFLLVKCVLKCSLDHTCLRTLASSSSSS